MEFEWNGTIDASVFVTDIAYHRNGVTGNGFHSVLFTHDGMKFIATVFPEAGFVAVLSSEETTEGGVVSSWRGDTFEAALREAIAVYTESLVART